MQRLKTNTIGIQQGSILMFSDFADNGAMWTGEGPREMRRAVVFADAFKSVPLVHVGISMWDIDQKTNQRADISAENVTLKGFTIVFRTWGDTRVARIRADWFAMGEAGNEDDWQLY